MQKKEIIDLEKEDLMQVLNSDIKSNKLLTVLAAYICIFYPLMDLGIGNIPGWIFLLGYWLFNMATRRGCVYLSGLRLSYTWIAFVVLVYFMMPNARNDVRTTQALIINICICALYLLSARISRDDILRIMKIFIIAGLVFSAYIIICRIFPSLYLNTILPRLRGANTTEITRLLRLGYGAHIAGSITYGSYIISMAAFFLLGDMLLGTKLYNRRISVICELIFVVAVLCEGRRSELVCLILAALIVYLLSTPNNARKILKRFYVLIGILIVAIIVIRVLVQYGYLSRFLNTIDLLKGDITVNNLNKLTSSRYRLWEGAWILFKTNPLFGIGWNSFSENIETSVNNVHNCYLQFLCEMGIVGFIAIVLPMMLWFIRSIKQLQLLIRHQENKTDLYGNAILLSVGMQIFFLILYSLDPVFYKGYYHMIHIMLIIFTEYCINNISRNKIER